VWNLTIPKPQRSPLTTWVILQMRPAGIEPASMLWKSTILPLNYERIKECKGMESDPQGCVHKTLLPCADHSVALTKELFVGASSKLKKGLTAIRTRVTGLFQLRVLRREHFRVLCHNQLDHKTIVASIRFDRTTFGLWVQRASAALRCYNMY
jgi:hypothetical protein